MSVALEIIGRARRNATELDYPLEQALADTITEVLYEVDAALFSFDQRYVSTSSEFLDALLERVAGFIYDMRRTP
jgi:type II secretory pathway component PulL